MSLHKCIMSYIHHYGMFSLLPNPLYSTSSSLPSAPTKRLCIFKLLILDCRSNIYSFLEIYSYKINSRWSPTPCIKILLKGGSATYRTFPVEWVQLQRQMGEAAWLFWLGEYHDLSQICIPCSSHVGLRVHLLLKLEAKQKWWEVFFFRGRGCV